MADVEYIQIKSDEQFDSKSNNQSEELSTSSIDVILSNDAILDALKEAAARGDLDAKLSLGMAYKNGRLGEPNYDLATKYLTEAADMGSDRAKLSLIQLYLCGDNIGENLYKIVKTCEQLSKNRYYEGVATLILSKLCFFIEKEQIIADLYDSELVMDKIREIENRPSELNSDENI